MPQLHAVRMGLSPSDIDWLSQAGARLQLGERHFYRLPDGGRVVQILARAFEVHEHLICFAGLEQDGTLVGEGWTDRDVAEFFTGARITEFTQRVVVPHAPW